MRHSLAWKPVGLFLVGHIGSYYLEKDFEIMRGWMFNCSQHWAVDELVVATEARA